MTNLAFMYFDLHHGMHAFAWKNEISDWLRETSEHPPTDFLRAAHEQGVMVYIPAEFMLLRKVVMPQLSVSELRQAIPFALEEDLIHDLDEVHFALRLDEEGVSHSIAVIAREHMDTCCTFFKKYRLPVVCLTSEIFLLPVRDSNSCSLMLTEHRYVLRLAEWLNFSGSLSDFESVFPLIQKQLGSDLHYVVDAYGVEPPASLLNYTIHRHDQLDGWMDRITTLNPDESTCCLNLLQGEYTYRYVSTSQKNRFRTASIAGVVMSGLIIVFYPLISGVLLSSRVSNLKMETETAYRAIFPNAQTVIAPKLRIEEKLAEYSTSGQVGSFLVLLSQLAEAKSNSTGIQFSKLDYQNHRIQLMLTADGSTQLSAFVERLQATGLTVKENNSVLEGVKVKTNLELS